MRHFVAPVLPTRASAFLAAAVMAALSAPSASAATYYWDNNGATAGFGTAAGTWDDPTTGDATQGWSTSSAGTDLPGNITTTTSDPVNFGTSTTGLAGGTITVNGTVAASSLTYGAASGAVTLSGGSITLGTGNITVNKAGQIIGSDITLNANGTITAGTTGTNLLTINGAIGGSANLTFTTVSTNFGGTFTHFTLGGASNYTGSTTITVPNTTAGHNNSLRVKITTDNALPTTTALTLDGFNGAGSGRNIEFDLNGRDQTLAGLTNVTRSLRNQTILNTAGTAATLTINNTADFVFSGKINGSNLALVKSGAGVQTLGGVNGYTGQTNINDGVLMVNGSIAAASTVTVNTGGTLGGSGSVLGSVSVLGGSIAPGASPGTLTIDTDLALDSASILAFELNAGDQTVGGGINDLITGVNDLTLDGTLNVTSAALSTGTWRLINYSGTLTNNGLSLGAISLAANMVASISTTTPGQVDLVVNIPEPASFVLLGIGSLLIAGRRRQA